MARRRSPCSSRRACCEPPDGGEPLMAAGTLPDRREEKAAFAPKRARRPVAVLTIGSLVAAVLALPLVFLLIEAQGAGVSEVRHLIFRSLTRVLLWKNIGNR